MPGPRSEEPSLGHVLMFGFDERERDETEQLVVVMLL